VKRRVLVAMAVLLVVLMTPTLGRQVGKVTSSQPTKNHLKVRRIEIDSRQIRIEGNASWWVRDHLAATLRNQARATGLVEIAVSGQEFEEVAASQDRIHDSGRYSTASKKQVPRGEMIAPTDHYVVTGSANISSKDRRMDLSIRGRSIDLSDTKISAVVKLTIEPVVISTGLSDPGYDVVGRASRSVDRNIAGRSISSFLRGESSRDSIEEDLLEEATEQAVEDFIQQFSPAKKPEVPKSTKK